MTVCLPASISFQQSTHAGLLDHLFLALFVDAGNLGITTGVIYFSMRAIACFSKVLMCAWCLSAPLDYLSLVALPAGLGRVLVL